MAPRNFMRPPERSRLNEFPNNQYADPEEKRRSVAGNHTGALALTPYDANRGHFASHRLDGNSPNFAGVTPERTLPPDSGTAELPHAPELAPEVALAGQTPAPTEATA